jgi:hypothetical protein
MGLRTKGGRMGEIITVSYSEIKRWRFCRMSHYYNYVLGIIPKAKAKPLKLGSITHKSIETWAKTGEWSNILSSVEKEYKGMFEEERELYGDLPSTITRLMDGYLKKYAKERRDYQLVEESLGPVPLTKRTQFKMRIDRLTTTQAGLTLCETKTAKRLPDESMRLWDLQTILYVWALRELGYPVKAVLWDYVRTKAPTVPQILKNGSISKRDVDTTYEVYLDTIKKNKLKVNDYQDILDELKGKSVDRFYKRVLLPVNDKMIETVLNDAKMTSLEMATIRHLPVRNISGYTCPRCFYSSICQASLRGLDSNFIIEKEYMPRKEEVEYGQEEEEESEGQS